MYEQLFKSQTVISIFALGGGSVWVKLNPALARQNVLFSVGWWEGKQLF
jgi:hypothetical protein